MDKNLTYRDHTARYCPGSKLTEDGGIAPTAFHLRKEESYLSVEWLEYLDQPSRPDEIKEVINMLSQKLHLGASAKIATLNVGTVCQYVQDVSMFSIRFLHEPESNDPAHSGIHDTDQDEMMIGELIAEKVENNYPVK